MRVLAFSCFAIAIMILTAGTMYYSVLREGLERQAMLANINGRLYIPTTTEITVTSLYLR
jgi:hypothetical protein